jgi:hypothetical protein
VGDHYFGADVVVEGDAQWVNESNTPVHIPAGTVIGGDL